jgi:hypothetical protein
MEGPLLRRGLPERMSMSDFLFVVFDAGRVSGAFQEIYQ